MLAFCNPTQVEQLVLMLKHKLWPDNSYFKAKDFEAILSAPREELQYYCTNEVKFGMRGPFFFFTCTLYPTGLMGNTTSHKDV